MPTSKKVLSAILNVSTACVVLLIVAAFWSDHRQADRQHDKESLLGSNVSHVAPLLTSSSRGQVILVLKVGCPYCRKSAAFYQTLAEKAKAGAIPPISVIMPNSAPLAHSYLTHLGLDFPLLSNVNYEALDVQGTPTILVVNSNGIIRHSWTGFLNPNGESRALKDMTL